MVAAPRTAGCHGALQPRGHPRHSLHPGFMSPMRTGESIEVARGVLPCPEHCDFAVRVERAMPGRGSCDQAVDFVEEGLAPLSPAACRLLRLCAGRRRAR
jgi:hypothetical protein